MKRSIKSIFCIVFAVAISLFSIGCDMSISVDGDGNIVPATKDVNINVKYSNQKSEATDPVTVIKSVRSTVVEIYVPVSSTEQSSGSGVVVGIDETTGYALVVTCHHVIEGGETFQIKSLDGTTFSHVELVGSDPVSDVGVLIIKDDNAASKVGGFVGFYTGELDVGTSVLAIGNPLGYLGGTVTQGIVSAVDRNVSVEGKTMNLIQADAAINEGNSGGGLFDARTGMLLGIVNAGYKPSAAQGLSFAISASTVLEKFDALVKTANETGSFGYIEGNFDLGVEFAVGAERVSSGNYQNYCVVIKSLDKYGLFKKGSLQAGDVIRSIKVTKKSDGKTYEFNIGALSVGIVNETISELEKFLQEKVSMGDTVAVYGRRYNENPGGTTISVQNIECSIEVCNYVYGKKN